METLFPSHHQCVQSMHVQLSRNNLTSDWILRVVGRYLPVGVDISKYLPQQYCGQMQLGWAICCGHMEIPPQRVQAHLFMQEHEKESAGGLLFPAKKQNKDNIHKIPNLVILLKWFFAITSCYVQQWGANKAIMQFSKVSLIKRWLWNVLSS